MYEVKAQDTFQLQLYPEVQQELVTISRHVKQLPGNHKVEIVISFLKDHRIRTEWFKGNGEMIKMITSRFLDTEHIEALFNAGRNNRAFIDDFERCISLYLMGDIA